MQAFLLVLFLFVTFCLVVAGVERVAFKLKSMLVGLVGRQTFNTFVIALILIYSGCGAYKSATTVQHPFTVLFLGASHTTTDYFDLAHPSPKATEIRNSTSTRLGRKRSVAQCLALASQVEATDKV